MLKDPPKPPRKFGTLLSGIPRPLRTALPIIGILLVLLILYSLLSGGKNINTEQLTSVMARAQEISRVSTLVKQQAKDADAKDLATTTASVLSSQQQELSSYLETNKAKVDTKKLAAKLDKSTDTALAGGLQNNNYDQIYFAYLKTNLVSYQNELDLAYKNAGTKGKQILIANSISIKTLQAAPQLK